MDYLCLLLDRSLGGNQNADKHRMVPPFNIFKMKKSLIFILLLFVCMNGIAQQPLTFSRVIQKEGADAQTLYDLTRNWFAQTFRDSKAVLQDQNSAKELTGHGKFVFSTNMMYSSIQGYIKYLIDIQFKDGRLRFEMSNFTHEPQRDALFNNHMGVMLDTIPKDLKEIGIEGANRKACYKYYFKNGKPLCEQRFIELSRDLEDFIEKREAVKEDW